jgi:hypothetical protein
LYVWPVPRHVSTASGDSGYPLSNYIYGMLPRDRSQTVKRATVTPQPISRVVVVEVWAQMGEKRK